VRNTCEIIHLLTDSNPIQVIVDAIINRCGALIIRKTPCRISSSFCSTSCYNSWTVSVLLEPASLVLQAASWIQGDTSSSLLRLFVLVA